MGDAEACDSWCSVGRPDVLAVSGDVSAAVARMGAMTDEELERLERRVRALPLREGSTLTPVPADALPFPARPYALLSVDEALALIAEVKRMRKLMGAA